MTIESSEKHNKIRYVCLCRPSRSSCQHRRRCRPSHLPLAGPCQALPAKLPAVPSTLRLANGRQMRETNASIERLAAAEMYRKASAVEAAAGFLAWVRAHHLAREWTVDDVWYLAVADYAESHDIELPPRRVFLGALKTLPGVTVVYDRRVRDRAGRILRKTTFYTFAAAAAADGAASAETNV